MDVEVRQARSDELDQVLAVLDDVGAWLVEIGMSEQWPVSFSSSPRWVEAWRRWIGEGRVYVGLIDSCVVGTFRLHESDEEIWGPDSAKAGVYLHTLAVNRRLAGRGVGLQLLSSAWRCAAERGRELRLDCWAGNERLRRYYSEAGFEACGEVQVTVVEDGVERTYVAARFARLADD